MVSRQSTKSNVNRKLRRGLARVQPNAAGIDIGSRAHYVAVPPDRDTEPVRNFGCYTPDLHEMARWLKDCGIETIAMESTGVYWVPAFQVLESYGFEVNLVDARHVSSVPGRETDVDDAQWLQELHSYGLLRGCFRPDDETAVLRTYWRHRGSLVECASRQILLMQKSLEQMNVQLHKAITDITGVTGMSIIRAIAAGERDPVELASFRQKGVKSTEEEIAKALSGDWREEHIFTLSQSLVLYDTYVNSIAECDAKIEAYMSILESKADPKELPYKPVRPRRKNEPHFDLREHLFRLTSVDLTAIDGIEAMTAQSIVTECGLDLSAFPTEKHFVSWLGLCPHNRITGGKVKSRATRKVDSRAATSLRLAAQSLHHSKSALGAYYRRMNSRLGSQKAITATAHKLASLVYRMIRHGMDYVDQGQQIYEQQYRQRQMKALKRQATVFGFALVDLQTGEVS